MADEFKPPQGAYDIKNPGTGVTVFKTPPPTVKPGDKIVEQKTEEKKSSKK